MKKYLLLFSLAVGVSLADERDSLWEAVSAARLAVQPVTAEEGKPEVNRGVRYFATNAGEDLTARFSDGGMKLASGAGGKWEARLSYANGRGTTLRAVGNRVEYDHGNGVTEWYVNRSQGIEHGFTVGLKQGEVGELRLAMKLGGVSGRMADDAGQAVDFIDEATGDAVARYDGLKVWDATGRTLASRMEASGRDLALVVDDAEAVYPVTVDPIITSLEAKLRPVVTGDGAPGDHFGTSVAIAGDYAVVGAPDDDHLAGANAGGAYVFFRSGGKWSLQTKLISGEAGAGDQFGYSVAISGDTVVVGARLDDTAAGLDAGSAWVFTRVGTVWSQQAKLLPGDPLAEDWFGYSVAVDGNTALVGATRHNAAEQDVGAGYVYVRSGTTWTQQARLRASDGSFVDNFGSSVSLSGNTALVGAEGDDYFLSFNGSTIFNTGSAYVFTRSGSTWTQQAKLLPNDLAVYENSNFGRSVSVSGNTALVGSPGESSGGVTDSGSAYVFVRNGSNWTRQVILNAGDKGAGDYFGSSVALAGETALVGSPMDDGEFDEDVGSGYVFIRSGTAWSQQAKLQTAVAVAGDQLGAAVALSGETAVVGTPNGGGEYPGDLPENSAAGSAAVFVRSGTAWMEQAEINAGDAAAGEGFGHSVAIDGDLAVVGAPGDDTQAGMGDGSAYLLKREGTMWSVMTKIMLPHKGYFDEMNDNFGDAVAISGDTVLIGAPGAFHQDGRAYVYKLEGSVWTQQAELDSGIADLGLFGASVALDGDVAVVGAPFQANARGRGFVFRRTGSVWSAPVMLAAGDTAQGDLFGDSVSISGDTILVGAPGEDPDSVSSAGSAYVFTASGGGWVQQAKLMADDKTRSDHFGRSVALSGDTALVGAPEEGFFDEGNLVFAGNGCGYIFKRSGGTWTQEAKLVASDGMLQDDFGGSVDLEGGHAVIGARLKDPGGRNIAGGAYVFSRQGGGWSEQAILVAADGVAEDVFGRAVALSGDTLLVGATGTELAHPYGEAAGESAGAAYVYRLTFPPDPRTMFDAAMAAAGLAEGNATALAMPFSDGVANLLKYGFNMDTGGPDVRRMAVTDGVSGLPSITRTTNGGQHYLRYTFVRRIGAGLEYSPMKSPDLATGSWMPVTDVPETQAIDTLWERVIYEEPYDPVTTPKLFGRIVVTLP